MLIVGIDMGYANLGLCAINTHSWVTPHIWRSERIHFPRANAYGRQRRANGQQAFEAIMRWCDENWVLLNNADAIILEQQLRSPFLEMNTVIKTRYDGKVFVYSPRSMIKVFGLPPKREAKKKATLAIINAMLNNCPYKDRDACDAALFILYHMITKLNDQTVLRSLREVQYGLEEVTNRARKQAPSSTVSAASASAFAKSIEYFAFASCDVRCNSSDEGEEGHTSGDS